MLNAARRLAARGELQAMIGKIANAPREDHPQYPRFAAEVQELMRSLAEAPEFHAGDAVRRAHARLREFIPFMHRDRALDRDVAVVCRMVHDRVL